MDENLKQQLMITVAAGNFTAMFVGFAGYFMSLPYSTLIAIVSGLAVAGITFFVTKPK